jgi:predicted kinase
MNKCYQLIGVPGAGKSTWIKNQTWALGMPVVSTDRYVEIEAKRQGKTYTEVFEEYMPIAVRLMVNHALVCQANNMDFIWDQTSTTVKTRAKKFNTLLPSQYEHIAVVFKTPEPDELARRLASRPGKVIPAEVMENMIRNFEYPSLDEGFKEIWVVGE